MTKGLAIGSEFVARRDFQASSSNQLSFFKGDILTLIESTTNDKQESNPKDWHLAEYSDGKKGLLPLSHLQKRTEVKINSMPWFHGKITRDEAERLLQPPKVSTNKIYQKYNLCIHECRLNSLTLIGTISFQDGLFLVRESTNFPGDYTLCVCFNGKVEHYRTIFMNNKYTIDEEGFFDSLIQLVDHYREDADGLCTSLKISMPKKCNKSDLKAFEAAGYAIKSEDLIFSEESLGRGETGDVVLANYGKRKVAVKIMKDTEEAIRSFTTEASLMTSLRHKNLVQFMGIVIDGPNICLVTEYMEKGSLSEYLRTRGRQRVTLKDQIKFAKDTCAGMAYLESNKVVHRDLAARNILISEDYTAKVCDFGLAGREKFSDIYLNSGAGCRIPVKWTAPESLRLGEFSSKSDMWSFGILLYEIYSFGRLPYPKIPLTDVVKYVESGYRMDAPEGCPKKIYEIMRRAWSSEPKDRPSFSEVLIEIEELEKDTDV